MSSLVIDIDMFKENIEGYNPANASVYHQQSAKMADTEFEKAIKSKKYQKVYFLCGGSAVGKSEFVSSYLKNDDALIFDSTFSSNTGVKAKLSKSKKCKVTVFFVQPRNILACFISFKGRKRQFDHKHFVRTHAGSREMALYILQKYTNVSVRCFVSELDSKGNMIYEEVIGNRNDLIAALKINQLTEENISYIIKPFIKFYEEETNTKKS